MFGDKFKKFEKVGRAGKPIISISPSGWMTFNAAIYKKHNLTIYNFCEFFFNEEENIIGIRFVRHTEEGSNSPSLIKMRKRISEASKLESADINIKAFMKYNEIQFVKKATAYEPDVVEDNDEFGMLIKMREGVMKGKKEENEPNERSEDET